MPRRIPDYPDSYETWNRLASFGSMITTIGVLVFFYLIYSALTDKSNYHLFYSNATFNYNTVAKKWENLFFIKYTQYIYDALFNNLTHSEINKYKFFFRYHINYKNWLRNVLKKSFLSFSNISSLRGGSFLGIKNEYRTCMLDWLVLNECYTFYEYLFKKLYYIYLNLYIIKMVLLFKLIKNIKKI